MEQLRTSLSPSEQAAEISRFVVQTTAQAAGRGPTNARTYVQRDVVTVILRDTLTKQERWLLEHGERKAVRNSRLAIARTISATLATGVEQITSRTVLSTHIDHQIEPDVLVVVFALQEVVA